MTDANKHGLSRHIPADIRREIRRRSRFGCVLCRCGFYQYEHIEPTFENANSHEPDAICCLCASCHSAVTRGQFSKHSVSAPYSALQTQSQVEVGPPVGPLDFHDRAAELSIGGLLYSPAVHTVLRYHNTDLIRVMPGIDGEPGRISAVFTDDSGQVTLRLMDNEWIGSLASWDTEVVGQCLTVRQARGRISLQLRLMPPGRIVVERLDMRMNSAHFLVSPTTYAVGRYLSDGAVNWVHAKINIVRSTPRGAAIEFAHPDELDKRDRERLPGGVGLADSTRETLAHSNLGVMIKPLGIVIGSWTGAFELVEVATGVQSVEDMRRVMVEQPEDLPRFISTDRSTVDK